MTMMTATKTIARCHWIVLTRADTHNDFRSAFSFFLLGVVPIELYELRLSDHDDTIAHSLAHTREEVNAFFLLINKNRNVAFVRNCAVCRRPSRFLFLVPSYRLMLFAWHALKLYKSGFFIHIEAVPSVGFIWNYANEASLSTFEFGCWSLSSIHSGVFFVLS